MVANPVSAPMVLGIVPLNPLLSRLLQEGGREGRREESEERGRCEVP
jgi:hypothetical protein